MFGPADPVFFVSLIAALVTQIARRFRDPVRMDRLTYMWLLVGILGVLDHIRMILEAGL